jgi:outer membrane protein OmpA-like peptidoglycan-associated protein
MEKFSASRPSSEPKHLQNKLTDENEDLTELRQLILGSSLQKLSAEEIGQALPDAIHSSSETDEKLTTAIFPTIEAAIKTSVNKDLNILSEALFPVIGPATRKAVSVAIQNLTQSLNQGLDNSLSPQSFKWRFEAFRTGKSFAEIVLLRTLLYQVEQVLLIHKETGLVLHRLESGTATVQDPELVSAMLTAIQDFVKDSFSVPTGSSLGTLEVGDLTIWIEEGPSAVLACIIRGNAPQDLRLTIQRAIENIHLTFDKELSRFQGNNAPFEATDSYLQDCLQSQYRTKSEKPSPTLKIMVGLLFLGLGIWGLLSYQDHQKWSHYVEALEQQPGIIVLQTSYLDGKHYVIGMRDPMAINPTKVLQENGYKSTDIMSKWKPFISLEPALLESKAKAQLKPPSQVSLKVDETGVLEIKGVAPQAWIESINQLSPSLIGITQVKTKKLDSIEQQSLKDLQQKLENRVILFSSGRTKIDNVQVEQFSKLAKEIQSCIKFSTILNQNIQFQILGFADSQGSKEGNKFISRERAEWVLEELLLQGIAPNYLKADIVSNKLTRPSIQTEELLKQSRKVMLKVIIKDKSNSK